MSDRGRLTMLTWPRSTAQCSGVWPKSASFACGIKRHGAPSRHQSLERAGDRFVALGDKRAGNLTSVFAPLSMRYCATRIALFRLAQCSGVCDFPSTPVTALKLVVSHKCLTRTRSFRAAASNTSRSEDDFSLELILGLVVTTEEEGRSYNDRQ